MKVLVACEFSGIVRDAFIKKGHDAVSCDILPTERQGPHIQGDVLQLLHHDPRWDMLIAHPPCTRLCNSGVRWLHERDLWNEMKSWAAFFYALLNHPAKHVAIENPVMHKYAKEEIGRGPDFTVQPWQFGDNFKKRTCFWTKNLPPLMPTSNLDGTTAEAEVHRASPSPDRAKNRSRTYPGMAKAMADQWG